MLYYANLAREFHWTQGQIDGTDLVFLLDMLAVEAKAKKPAEQRKVYIDELL